MGKSVRLAAVFAWLLSMVCAAAQADVTSGVQWLAGTAQSNGSYALPNDIATPFQSTAETLRTFNALGVTPAAAAQQFLAAEPYGNTENLSRQIINGALNGQDVSALVIQLGTHQDSASGGFAELPGYQPSVLDTAFALEALALSGNVGSQGASGALGFLQQKQATDGSWTENDGDNLPSIYLTALALRSIWYYRQYYAVSPTLQKASQWLLGQADANGNWAAPFLSAQALIAIAPTLLDRTSIQANLNALQAQQLSDGSFIEDTYTTALALRALQYANSPSPDQISVHGRVIDGQTGNTLGGVTVTLTGPQNYSATTGADGSFGFVNIVAGSYSIQIADAGFNTVISTTQAGTGQSLNLGTISLTPASASSSSGGSSGGGSSGGGSGGSSGGSSPATVDGTVTDATTGNPIAGAKVSAGGLSATTASDGTYEIPNIPAGNASLSASASGYQTVTGSATLGAGMIAVFSPKLSAGAAQGSGTASLSGTVTDANTSKPIQGASISVSGGSVASTQTDANGNYSIAGLSPGSLQVTASAAGYDTVSASAQALGNSNITFSPQLYASGTSPAGANTASITGVVVDSTTNLPIAAATVGIKPGTGAHSYWRIYITGARSAEGVVADLEFRDSYGGPNKAVGGTPIASSQYSSSYGPANAFDGNPQTWWNSTLGAPPYWVGYQFSAPVEVVEYSITAYQPSAAYSPTDWQFQYSDDGAAWTTADSQSSQNLGAGQKQVYSLGQLTMTDSIGRFTLSSITIPYANLTFASSGYVSEQLGIPLAPAQQRNIGQVRLRPVVAVQQLPDLTVALVDAKSSAHTDPQSLQLSGSLQVSISNIGTAATTSSFNVLAFYDVNQDGAYESGTDTLLGTASVSNPVAVGQTLSVQVPVSGKLPFRDAPVSVLADSGNEVVEISKSNNFGTSASMCLAQTHTGGFTPVVKWAWSGGTLAPQYNQVMMAPLVMRVHDDNGDGKIDQSDTPDLIFVAYSSYNGDLVNNGMLRIVSGKDGSDLAMGPDPQSAPQYAMPSYANLAAGDLYGDGNIEIVGPRGGGGLVAFAHDGTPLWTVNWPNSNNWDFGAPAIVDLYGNGHPVIIFGGHVVSGTGQLLWSTNNGYVGGSVSYGSGGIAVDLNNDGNMAVLFGASAFSANGQPLWQNSGVGDGIDAIGRFNKADPYPEIVVVGPQPGTSDNGRVTLLDHNGNIIWGPVLLPGLGRGGAPIVADFDGDGVAEIGVAGANNYTVFNSDGSVKWTSKTQDHTSACTSSSTFDFYNDGRREIVYGDEQYLRIYNGADGTVLYQTLNQDGTAYELPVIADMDGSGHAELAVISNDYPPTQEAGGTHGIRVFADQNNQWADTRQLWNQLSYHINNVNDDGSIPLHETPSWSTHNTYRLNTFVKQNPFGQPDLTAGLLQVIDNGTGNPLTLSARIGNGGQIAAPATTASFYSGDPANGGTLIGTVSVSALNPSSYQDVQLTGVTGLSTGQDVYVVVDPQNLIQECDKTNNVDHVPLAAAVPAGAISVSTDAPSYGPNAAANFSGIGTNQGSLSADFKIDLRVEDSAGNLVTDLGTTDLGVVAGGASANDPATWSTGTTLAGSYVLHGLLLRADGNLVAEARAPFSITAGTSGGGNPSSVVTLRISTDRSTYYTTDQVNIGDLVQDISANSIVNNASLQLTVLDPNGATVLSLPVPLGQLTPGYLRQLSNLYALKAATLGRYTVNGAVVDASNTVLATATAIFNVVDNLGLSIAGSETVAQPVVYQDDPQTCTDIIVGAERKLTQGAAGKVTHLVGLKV